METSSNAKDRHSLGNKSVSSAQGSTKSSLATPKTIEKKLGARKSSESPSTPGANKIAKMSPRATRSSQNPDFAAKQRKFLNRVHDPIRRDYSDSENSQGSIGTPVNSKLTKENKTKSVEKKNANDMKRPLGKDNTLNRSVDSDEEVSPKKRRTKEPTKVVGGVDSYCWQCHRDGNVIRCEICPRVYHLKCVKKDAPPPKGWMCPECSIITKAENTDTRSRAMRLLTLDQFCNLLRFALNRMKKHDEAEDFIKPVDISAFPYYRDFIVKAMDLSQLERNIKNKMYGSTEAFVADTKWIVHNSIIFNSVHSKFTSVARGLLKICRHEMQEIENCPDCYLNAHTRSTDSWFIEACRRPHLLVWAKLKGFPFWPAKALCFNNDEGTVDVRFFGAHDRAWVPLNCCYLYSKLSPSSASNKNKRSLEDCVQELEMHIKKLKDKFGQFEYPPYKTLIDPDNENGQLAMFLPRYHPKTPGKGMQRMCLYHDGQRKSLPSKPAVLASKAGSPASPAVLQKPSPSQAKSSPLVKDMVPASKQVSHAQVPTSPNFDQKPMVSIYNTFNNSSGSSLSTPGKTSQGGVKEKTPEQQTTPTFQGIKKSYKTPLTAAAKKCFATEDKICFKCKTLTTIGWSIDSSGKTLCSSCTLSPDIPNIQEKAIQEDKVCGKCQSLNSDTWHLGPNEELLCAACSAPPSKEPNKPEIPVNSNEQARNSNSPVKRVGTPEKNHQVTSATSNELSDALKTRDDDVSVNKKHAVDTRTSADIDKGAGGDGGTLHEEDTTHRPSASGDIAVEDFEAVDSPPKFIISKVCANASPESLKKGSIVDRLQEKLCFAVEEALKDHLTTDEELATLETNVEETNVEETNANEAYLEENNLVESNVDKTNSEEPNVKENNVEKPNVEETNVEKTNIKETSVEESVDIPDKDSIKESMKKDNSLVMQVLLHDLKNDKEMMEKIKEIETKQNINKSKDTEMDVQMSSESGSEADTDTSSSVESDSFVTGEDKKRKQKNINSVVRSLKERKSSVEERSEHNNNNNNTSHKGKESCAVVIDDTSNEIPILIIDEGDSSDSKKSPVKSDKSRRKGIPAKVYSRSSTSTESSETSSPDEQSGKSKNITEVLDEVSGQFRRSSADSNLTITLVTEDAPPQKKTPKEIRSVNISKSLSLSVINDTSTGLEMECVDSDLDDQVIVDSTFTKLTPRPTARKTLPNPPRLLEISVPQEKYTQSKPAESELRSSTIPTRMEHPTPPLTPLYNNQRQQTRVNGIDKGVNTNERPIPNRSSSNPRAELGPANALLEDAVEKMSSHLRCLIEQVLDGMSQAGSSEANIKSLQLEMERLTWRHRQQMLELKHNTDLIIMEMKATMEADKQRALIEFKHKYSREKEEEIIRVKEKQWCSQCHKEAQLYCCWNTSYCSYACQELHWAPHMINCGNKQQATTINEDGQATSSGMMENQSAAPRMLESQAVAPRLHPTPGPSRMPYNVPSGQMHDDDAWIQIDDEGHKHVARKRCGECQGCTALPCGQCYGCTHPKSHTVCKNRRCSLILTKPPQRMRQQQQVLMPPPPNPPPPPPPPPYQPIVHYRPNQLYTGTATAGPPPRFNQQPRPNPLMFHMNPHFPRGPM